MGGVAWTEEEDRLLKKCIDQYGEGKWHMMPLLAGLNRCRKSCRLRWLNYLRPNIKRGNFAQDEEQLIIKLHKHLGNRWSLIAKRLPGRTANDVKNYWNCHLTKKLYAQGITKHEDHQKEINVEILRPQPGSIAKAGSIIAPKSQQTIGDQSSMSTPFEYVEVYNQPGQEVVKEEDRSLGVEEPAGIFVGDLSTDDYHFGQFDEVNVLGTDEGCSKFDWDDLILDMDSWTDLL
ncbi:hypothetical protein PTKIN_Ptkin01aG0362400 [Pterospermum kingtungense]